MKKIISFLSEVKSELAQVSWPKRVDVIKLTVIVLAISAIVGLYVGGLDFGLTKTLEEVISR